MRKGWRRRGFCVRSGGDDGGGQVLVDISIIIILQDKMWKA